MISFDDVSNEVAELGVKVFDESLQDHDCEIRAIVEAFVAMTNAMSNEDAADNGEENPCAVGCNIESCIYKGVSAGDCFGCIEWESKKLSAIMSGQ